MKAPPLGYCTRARVARVVDGDTLEVVVTKQLTVRLLDCWAPETRGAGREAGERARAELERVAAGREAVVFVPAGDMHDMLTLSRMLAHVWVGGRHLASHMVARGLATAEKRP